MVTRRETGTFGAAGRMLAALVVLLAAALVAAPATARAQVRIADGTSCSLTVEKCPAEGQGFHLALVARMDATGRLEAVPALVDAVAETGIDPATFSESTDAQALSAAASSYQGYVASGKGSFDERDAEVTGGTASFSGLEPGMYLLTADPATVGGSTYAALPNLVIVPRVDGSTYATDCQVEAKFEVLPAEVPHNRVTKLWQGDSASARPESVRVAIYDGDALYQEVTLDASNNWTFAWDGEGSWSVREKDVPSGYTCSVLASSVAADAGEDASGKADASKADSGKADSGKADARKADAGKADASKVGTSFTLTNKASGEKPKESPKGTGSSGTTKPGPKTGDATSPLLPAALLCAGGALLLCGLAGRRKEKDRA